MLLRHWNEATDGTPDQKAQSPPYMPRIARNDTSSAATGWRLRFLVSSISCFVQSYQTLRGIRPRLNATARHVKATDYVGQASGR